MQQSGTTNRRACWCASLVAAAVTGVSLAPAAAQEQSKPPVARVHPAVEFYAADHVQVVHVRIEDRDLERMKSALPKRIYVPATFRWKNVTVENVGIRYKGNSSSSPRQRHKRSFLIKFNEYDKGGSFLGLRRVSFDNGVQFGSLFSERLITPILQDLQIPAARCNYAKLYVNGAYQGVYVNVERVDSVFLHDRFADGNGALYKVDEGGPGGDLRPVARGPAGNVRGRLAFETKSDAADPNARDVLALIAKINNTSGDEFPQVMNATLEMDTFLKTMAVLLFSGAFDQLTGWNSHNYYLYHEPGRERWHYIPWDLDVGFADNAFRRVPVLSGWNAAWPEFGHSPSPLVTRIVDNPRLLARYRRFADEILEKHFHPRVLLPQVDALYAQIKDDLDDDPFPHRRVTNPDDRGYDDIVASIKEFIRRRYDKARAQLDEPGTRPPLAKRQPRDNQPKPGPASPDAPSELRVVSQTKSSITLEWKDNAEGEAGTILQRAVGANGEFRNHIGQPGANVTTATDRNVAPGMTYRYRVYSLHPTPLGPRGTGTSKPITVRAAGL